MPLVSIISPIHNSEPWLRETLDTFCNQTLEDIEILLIDDDSTDNSAQIMQEYKEKDKRIKTFHRKHDKNELWGYTNAVNIGRKNATGDYIIFPDSDDLLDLDGLEKLYNASENGTIDIIKGGMDVLDEDKNIITSFPKFGSEVISNWMTLDEKSRIIHLCPGAPQLQTYLIRREFQKNIPFCKFCYMDTTTPFKFKVLANSFKYIEDRVYCSIAHNKEYNGYDFEIIKVFDELDSFLKNFKVHPDIWAYFNYFKLRVTQQMMFVLPVQPNNIVEFLKHFHRDLQNINLSSLPGMVDQEFLNYVKNLNYDI